MFSKKRSEQVLGGIVIGGLALGLAGYWFAIAQMSEAKIAGFLVGLGTGNLSVIAGQMWKHNKANFILRILFVVLSPIGIFILLPFSPTLAGAYFLGSSASFSFSWALASMLEALSHPPDR